MNTNKTAVATAAAMAAAPADENHMSSVRGMLIEQMRALRSAPPEQLATESERARSVALVAQAITSAARVEVQYAEVANRDESPVPFLQTQVHRVSSPMPGTTRHRLLG